MMYYVNWVLTNAQLELLAADVSVVDYNYGDKKKRKKGEHDDTPVDSEALKRTNEKWLAEHEKDGGRVDMTDILGNLKQSVGLRIRPE